MTKARDFIFLQRFLFSFSTEFVVCRRVEVFELDTTDMTRFRAKARGRGEPLGSADMRGRCSRKRVLLTAAHE